MDAIEFVFFIIAKFHIIGNPARVAHLRAQAEAWYYGKERDEEGKPIPQNKIAEKINFYGERWYVQLGLAIAIIPLVGYIQGIWNKPDDIEDYMNR